MEKKTLADTPVEWWVDDLPDVWLAGYNQAVDEANRIIIKLQDEVNSLLYRMSGHS